MTRMELLRREHDCIVSKSYQESFHTIELSELGGPYELVCQLLLWKSYLKLRGRKMSLDEILEWMRGQEWIGRIRPSVGQVTAVASHLSYLLEHGYVEWITRAVNKRVYLIDWKLLDIFEKHYLGGEG
mgnify:CR=1 FL=1